MRGADRKKIADFIAAQKIVREPCHPLGPGTAYLLADGTFIIGGQIFQEVVDGISDRRLWISLE